MALTAGFLTAAATVGTAIDTHEQTRKAKNTQEDQYNEQLRLTDEEKKKALAADQAAATKADEERRKRIKELQTKGRPSTFNVSPFASASNDIGARTMLG